MSGDFSCSFLINHFIIGTPLTLLFMILIRIQAVVWVPEGNFPHWKGHVQADGSEGVKDRKPECVHRHEEAQSKWNGLKAFGQTEELDIYKEGCTQYLDGQTNRHIGPGWEKSLSAHTRALFLRNRDASKWPFYKRKKESPTELMWSFNLESSSRTDMKWRLMLSAGLERTRAGKTDRAVLTNGAKVQLLWIIIKVYSKTALSVANYCNGRCFIQRGLKREQEKKTNNTACQNMKLKQQIARRTGGEKYSFNVFVYIKRWWISSVFEFRLAAS